MRIKKMVAIITASMCLSSMQVPALAQNIGTTSTTVIAKTNEDSTIETTDDGSSSEISAESVINYEEATGNPAIENIINTHSVMVIQAFKFADGSIDIWQTGSGLIVTNDTVIAPAELSNFSSSEDTAYVKLAKTKKDLYARVGVDLNDFDNVQSSFVTYVVPADGKYIECTCKYSDPNIGLAMMVTSTGLSADGISYSENYISDMTLAGFSSESLNVASTVLTQGEKSCTRGDIITTTISDSNIQENQISASTMMDLGYVGGTLYGSDGSICGMVLSINETSGTVVNGLQLKNFVEVGPEDEEDNISQTNALDKLELAVERAKNIDVSGYTDESVEAFTQAIADAEAVLSDVNATVDDINTAGENLNNAKAALTESTNISNQNLDLKKITKYGGLATIVLAVVIAAIFYFLKGRNLKKENKKTNNRTEKSESAGYGGEAARRSFATSKIEDDGEEGTTVLGTDGEDETTVLKQQSQTESYLVSEDGEKIKIYKKEFILGKEKRKVSHCITGNTTISRRHCMIKNDGRDIYLEDLGSLNGTFVNGIQLTAHVPVKLSDGDVIMLSDITYVFHIEE